MRNLKIERNPYRDSSLNSILTMKLWRRDFLQSDHINSIKKLSFYLQESILERFNLHSYLTVLSIFYYQSKSISNKPYSCEQSRLLLELYNFKIVPLLNPDGVSRGYFRLDTYNHNLNRFYLNPDPKWQPTIYAAKEALV
jgi:hypothetical protein